MPPLAPPRLNATTWSLLALLGLIWGGSFFFGRVAVPYVPPMTLAFWRELPAAVRALDARVSSKHRGFVTSTHIAQRYECLPQPFR